MNNEINHEINHNKIKIKRKRCPKGQRRYPPKTGECIDKALLPRRKKNNANANANAKPEPESVDVVVVRESESEPMEPSLTFLQNDPILYPNYNDPLFNIKITEKKEFHDTTYDGKIYDVQTKGDELCNTPFELNPHQKFVRNFLSFQTPYNSLLLYHGLGTGKTCSAISVAEEMRDYLKQVNNSRRIIVVASPNVQENFKLQLFDETKLKEENGFWNIRSCTGNKFLKEINPMNMKNLSKEKVIKRVKQIIKQYYLFMGYIGFANYIDKMSSLKREIKDQNKRKALVQKKLEKIFNNRMIIIDEIHNIRMTEENKNKLVANKLSFLVDNVKHMRLLLLSATPMYNTYKEIIWLLNLMNKNDNRSIVKQSDVFNSDGSFKIDNQTGEEIGKKLLIQKATGYVSFVRGENPYTFPYRIFPALFDNTRSFYRFGDNENRFIRNYPEKQMNGLDINPLQHIDVYLSSIQNTYQKDVYMTMLELVKEKINKDASNAPPSSQQQQSQDMVDEPLSSSNPPTKSFSELQTFGYNALQPLLQTLNIVYPVNELSTVNVSNTIGKKGLKSVIKYKISETENKERINFEYIRQSENESNRIFKQAFIKNYSSKIYSICENIEGSEGIVLIYSQYIDAGIIPMALALEEMGFERNGRENFFKKEVVSSDTIKNRNAKYSIISGNKSISPNNVKELKALTSNDNLNGEKVKVVLISQAGAEGLDFKNIRQIHIMEPWYNMKRIEQIIGRGVRNCSHKLLVFAHRNVQLYLHGTLLNGLEENQEYESADLYVYRIAESKAMKMGAVSRILKETSIDCILNKEQQMFTEEKMNQQVSLSLSKSSQPTILYQVGDKPFSSTCDYMESCTYECVPDKLGELTINDKTYGEAFIIMNNDKIMERIKQAMKEKYVYTKRDLIKEIRVKKEYPIIQIDYALTQLIEDDTEFITDVYNRIGRLINIGELYLFQPIELTNKKISMFERTTLPLYKPKQIRYIVPTQFIEKKKSEEEIKKEEKQQKLKLINELDEKYTISMYSDINDKIKTNDPLKWYKYFSKVRNRILNNDVYSNYMDVEMLKEFLVEHMFDMLSLKEKKQVVHYLYKNNHSNGEKNEEITEFSKVLKELLDRNKLYKKDANNIFMVLYNDKDEKIVLLKKDNKDNTWKKASLLEEKRWKENSNDYKERIKLNKQTIGTYLGFIMDSVFKVKNIRLKRHIGATCLQSGKKKAVALLNNILEKGKPIGFDSIVYDIKGNAKELQVIDICILQELILRLYHKRKLNEKIWFMDYMNYVENNIKKFSI